VLSLTPTAILFIVMRADVPKPRFVTSEPAEHMFGQLRQMIREFTVAEFAQLVEKLIRRLEMMCKHGFRPSRDPQKGYTASFEDYFLQSLLPVIDELSKGAVNITNDGDFVAKQMWRDVSKIISFSSKNMVKLFDVLGAAKDEMSPFCRSFTSLDDLRDEFIRYLPNTFTYDAKVPGNAADENVPQEEDEDGNSGEGDDANRVVNVVADRIRRFAEEMRGQQDVVVVDDDDDDDSEEYDPSPNDTVVAHDEGRSSNKTEELMTNFRAIFCAASVDALKDCVLRSSSSMACSAGQTAGSTSQGRKTMSLVQRWIAQPFGITEDKDALVAEDILIERDVIILAHVKIGSGVNSTTVVCPFRVLMIHEKCCNKWFVSKSLTKRWKKEDKPFKAEIRMLQKNEVDEHCDIELYNTECTKDEICKNIKDDMILDVVGKLQVIG